jgi:hypothetical protein
MLHRLSTITHHFSPHASRTYATMSLKHLKPIKFYSLATPNGVKVSTFLEDLKNEYELPYECVCLASLPRLPLTCSAVRRRSTSRLTFRNHLGSSN